MAGAGKRLWAKVLPSGLSLYANKPFEGTVRIYSVMLKRSGHGPERVCSMVTPSLDPRYEGHYRTYPGVPEAIEEARRLFLADFVMAA